MWLCSLLYNMFLTVCEAVLCQTGPGGLVSMQRFSLSRPLVTADKCVCALSNKYKGPEATSVCGLQLLLYEALRY
jgi:hypothetical protein